MQAALQRGLAQFGLPAGHLRVLLADLAFKLLLVIVELRQGGVDLRQG